MQSLSNLAGKELGVDIEGHDSRGVRRGCAESSNSIIFCVVDSGNCEGLVEELGIGTHRHYTCRLKICDVFEGFPGKVFPGGSLLDGFDIL